MISRFQRFLRQLRFAIGPYRPIRKPAFLADERLELQDGEIRLREAMQRDLIGPREPIDYDSLPNG